MSQLHEDEAPQVYYIPGNYDDSGGVLGGRIGTRNAVELFAICGPVAFLEYNLLHFSIQTNLIIAIITLLPLAALCIFGIGGESLSQIAMAFIRYNRKKRILHYDIFTPNEEQNKLFNLDKFLDIAASSGIKAAIEKFKEEHMDDRQDATAAVKPKSKKQKLGGRHRTSDEIGDLDKELKEDLRKQERAITGQTKGWMSAARKDKGHKRLNNPTARKKK